MLPEYEMLCEQKVDDSSDGNAQCRGYERRKYRIS